MENKRPHVSYQESPKSSLQFSAQIRCFEKKYKTKKVKNPFEPPNVKLLEENTLSPDMFSSSHLTTPENAEFMWTIDEISKIQPASIDSPASILDDTDEHTESIAQEAIKKYFQSTHHIDSPEDAYTGVWTSLTPDSGLLSMTHHKNHSAPSSSTPNIRTENPKKRKVCDYESVMCQTEISFPSVLPPEVEAILQKYTTEYNNCEREETNPLNSSGLRRKLLFHSADESLNAAEVCDTAQFDSPTPDLTCRISRINWSASKTDHESDVCSSPELSPIRKLGSASNQCGNMSTDNCQEDDEQMAVSLMEHD